MKEDILPTYIQVDIHFYAISELLHCTCYSRYISLEYVLRHRIT